jgi:acyl-coenzyme A synthetase/AMP-(fatty) acid ligase
MNFAEEVLEDRPPHDIALVELARDGSRHVWTFGDVDREAARMATTLLTRGVERGDVVMTLIGNRPDWVWSMMACFRLGTVVLPCNEQLRAKDLGMRLQVTRPELIVADERNREELQAAEPDCPVLWVGDGARWAEETSRVGDPKKGCPTRAGAHTHRAPQSEIHTTPPPPPPTTTRRTQPEIQTASLSPPLTSTPHTQQEAQAHPTPPYSGPASIPRTGFLDPVFAKPPPPYADLKEDDPALITFTSGTAGEPKAVVHGQRYLYGQRVQAESWLGAEAGDLVWCTAASGWSKSARNAWIAPWLMGAKALLHDARFDPHERLDLIEREEVNVLCMAPTEYRVIAKRTRLRKLPSLKGMVAAGEALNPEVLKVWREATGLEIRDGYGQTETGQMTGMGIGIAARTGSMGRALPGVRLSVRDGELVAEPRSVGTFFLGYLGEGVERTQGEPGRPRWSWKIDDRREGGPWRTGDQVSEDEDGYLRFQGRADDVIVSAGYRIGPFEVESALVAHPAVAEAAAVSAPDEERGAVVRAIVVLREGHEPSVELAQELQEHVKQETAPYKYPRIVEFTQELPKTASGKIKRAELRDRR